MIPIRNIKLTIEYDGTNFNGWQIQKNAHRTIQNEIERVLKKVFKKHVHVYASGRTDSGVHALAQVANFKVSSRLTTDEILRAINASLPDDVSIIDVQEVEPHFHAQYSAKSKTYRYTILNRKGRSPLHRNVVHHYAHHLNISLMRKEAQSLIGKKDFKSFQATPAQDQKGRNTVRIIKSISILKKGDFIYIDIEATGFLHKMVRNIVGTLLEIAKGQRPRGSIAKILKTKSRLSAGKTAPARGLCLLKVKY